MTVAQKIERVFFRICDPSTNRPRSPEPHGHLAGGSEQHGSGKGSPTSGAHELCADCCELDLRAMLEEEKREVDMGSLSDHLTEDCPLCNLVSQAVRHHWGEGWSSSRLCDASDPIPRLFIQSRSALTIKNHGHVEHPEPRLLLALDVTPPGFHENRRVIRQIDRVKNRHIIAEIERVLYSKSGAREPPLVPRREVGRSIDYELVKRWLNDCKDHPHTKKASKQMALNEADTKLFGSRDGFRLIDVKDECLVLRKEPCAFAALSYVWGPLPTVLNPREDSDEIPILLTTKDTLGRLSTPKGLSAESVGEMKNLRLPQTVLDAMEFARRIGMRHLWVDTLCIVQDDVEDKKCLIQAMDDVYDIASVTFVAATGKDADAGLSGISPRKGRPINPETVIDDGVTEHLSLCPPSLGEEVRHSTWNTRGWTFQEQALSQRCLYFTEEELFFNCIELQYREAYALEYTDERPRVTVRTGPPWWGRNLRNDPDPTPYHYLGDLTGTLTIKDYQTAVQDYSRKTLSYAQDVLQAFEGVLNRFAKCEWGPNSELSIDQTQGIPVNHLHQALLWFPSDEAARRRCEAVEFSTWSWASWDGAIEFVFADSMWLSRNISQVPLKKIPIHVLIPCWHYGKSAKKYFTQEIWEAACEKPQAMGSKAAKECDISKAYAKDKIGVDMDMLLTLAVHGEPPLLEVGELGFFGAYLGPGDVSLSAKGGRRVFNMEIGPHEGEFRFDEEGGEADEFVAVVASDTITKSPDVQSILLGLKTEKGVCKRVGLGWVYYSKKEDATLPSWQYRFFKLA